MENIFHGWRKNGNGNAYNGNRVKAAPDGGKTNKGWQ